MFLIQAIFAPLANIACVNLSKFQCGDLVGSCLVLTASGEARAGWGGVNVYVPVECSLTNILGAVKAVVKSPLLFAVSRALLELLVSFGPLLRIFC